MCSAAPLLDAESEPDHSSPLIARRHPMKATIRYRFNAELHDDESLYERVRGVVERLADVHLGFREWWTVPAKARQSPFALGDREDVLKLIEMQRQEFQRKYPGVPLSVSNGILLSNARSEKQWRANGSITIAINPGPGEVRLDIGDLSAATETPTELVWSSLRALTEDPRAVFAQTNVKQSVGKDRKLYSLNCGVFPHRDFLGWMGYVNQAVSGSQVPDAERVERQGQGTLILATEKVDLFDARLIEKMNKVEISLAELGLLPITDASISE